MKERWGKKIYLQHLTFLSLNVPSRTMSQVKVATATTLQPSKGVPLSCSCDGCMPAPLKHAMKSWQQSPEYWINSHVKVRCKQHRLFFSGDYCDCTGLNPSNSIVFIYTFYRNHVTKLSLKAEAVTNTQLSYLTFTEMQRESCKIAIMFCEWAVWGTDTET